MQAGSPSPLPPDRTTPLPDDVGPSPDVAAPVRQPDPLSGWFRRQIVLRLVGAALCVGATAVVATGPPWPIGDERARAHATVFAGGQGDQQARHRGRLRPAHRRLARPGGRPPHEHLHRRCPAAIRGRRAVRAAVQPRPPAVRCGRRRRLTDHELRHRPRAVADSGDARADRTRRGGASLGEFGPLLVVRGRDRLALAAVPGGQAAIRIARLPPTVRQHAYWTEMFDQWQLALADD